MASNVFKFRTVKHGDPQQKLEVLPDAPPKPMALAVFAVLSIACGLLAFAVVYVATF